MFTLSRTIHWKRREKPEILVAALNWEYRVPLGATREVWI